MTLALVLALMAAQATFVPVTAEERYVADLRAQIARGDVEAEVSLGNLYEAGDVLPQDTRQAAEWYRRELAGVKGVTLPPADGGGNVGAETESVYHMFVIRLETNDAREALARRLKEQGIESGVHYPVPNHRQPAIEEVFGAQPALPRTEDTVRRILSLPMFPSITEDEVRAVADAIKAFVRG